ncbi:DUF1772 domain-containing protein [Hoeflea sp.]|uniref:anthrone oxygenase family protein n=1 Tax=Hoeflea sp. TaxID=1940281 RepID=UPI003A931291
MISTRVFPLASLLLSAAIFGFFYAWVCSTMWGLDAAGPAVAIEAMQAMNASVRNAVFFPAFFLTPVVLAVTAALLMRTGRRGAAIRFALAAGVYATGGFGVTVIVNVPMNQALAQVVVPDATEAAGEIWRSYSERCQLWNQVRAMASGLAVLLTGIGLLRIS